MQVFSSNESFSIESYCKKGGTLILKSDSSENEVIISFEETECLSLKSKLLKPVIFKFNMAEKAILPDHLKVDYSKTKNIYRIETETFTGYLIAGKMEIKTE